MGKADDEAHDGLALRVGLDITDEVPVDLDRIERKVLEIAQRGITGAKVGERGGTSDDGTTICAGASYAPIW
ncbi:UNVERIFIED_ORG: hypothetical protein GGD48_004970 [Rhizobium etli]